MNVRNNQDVIKERQLAGIAKAKAEGKSWGGRKPGTRIRLTQEKEALIRQLHAEGKPIAAIARLVGLSRKSVYKPWRGQGTWPEPDRGRRMNEETNEVPALADHARPRTNERRNE